jgi:NADPH oxidase
VVFFASLLAHGSFCFITNDPGKPDKCRGGPAFYKWWLFSCVCYLFDRLYREYRGSRTTSISKIIHHPAKVMELQFQKPELVYKPGQYIYLKCPAISWMEWHPFTLTSCPQENHYSVHIRAVGPWTKALAAAFDGPSLPRIMIDGSYGSPCQDVFKYQAAVLIGAGIGVTPFASILKSIWYELKTRPLNKVYFYWICKNTQEFVWFQDLLKTFEEDNFEHILEINIYLTKPLCANEVKNIVLHDGLNGVDAITELHAATRYGRPIWSKEFERISRHKCKIAVVSCGPKTLSDDLAAQCKAFSVNGTVFEYFCEGFNQ